MEGLKYKLVRRVASHEIEKIRERYRHRFAGPQHDLSVERLVQLHLDTAMVGAYIHQSDDA
jgi:type II secretory pathway predicted ATPase ExeA